MPENSDVGSQHTGCSLLTQGGIYW